MGCIKRELEAFKIEKGYFPKDQVRNTAPTDSRGIPAGIDCFLKNDTNLTPYNSIYDYENWSTSGGCIVKITFFGKDKDRQSSVTNIAHQQSGFYNDKERDRNSDDLILSLGLQPSHLCGS